MAAKKLRARQIIRRIPALAIVFLTAFPSMMDAAEPPSADKAQGVAGVKVVASNDGNPVLSIFHDPLLLDVRRFDLTVIGPQFLSLKVIGISSEAVYELAGTDVRFTGDAEKATIYVATAMSLPVRAGLKDLVGSCSLVGSRNVTARFSRCQIDSKFNYAASSIKRFIEISPDGETILLADCWLKKDADNKSGSPLYEIPEMPYSSWKKELIIQEVKRRKDAFVILVLLSCN